MTNTETTETEEKLQGFRPAIIDGISATSTSTPNYEITQIPCHFDPETEKQVVYWKDITNVIKNATHVKTEGESVLFLRDEFKK